MSIKFFTSHIPLATTKHILLIVAISAATMVHSGQLKAMKQDRMAQIHNKLASKTNLKTGGPVRQADAHRSIYGNPKDSNTQRSDQANHIILVTQFHNACSSKQAGRVALILKTLTAHEQYRLICSQNIMGYTALHIAVQAGSQEIITIILDVAKTHNSITEFLSITSKGVFSPGKTALELAQANLLIAGEDNHSREIVELLKKEDPAYQEDPTLADTIGLLSIKK